MVFLEVQKYTKKNINPRVSGTSNDKSMILSKCATCSCKKSRFIKNQKANGVLSNLGLRTPVLGDIFFWAV